MVLIGSANLEDARNPPIIRLFATTFAIICVILVLDG
jgi:hypothetical protein